MKREEAHHSDPEILGGTRVPVQTLLDYLEGGDTLDGFPSVSREQAVACLEMNCVLESQVASDFS